MRVNPLVAAVVVLALLGGAVWYTRENPPADQDAAPKIVDVEEDAVTRVMLRKRGEDPVELVRGADGEWAFGGDTKIPADESAIGTLVASLASLNAERLVSDAVVDWEPYDLDEPEFAVGYGLEEGGGEILFGRETPTRSGVFARLRDDPRLFTVYSYNKSAFEKSVYDLRDKRLLRLEESTISEIRVDTSGRALRFVREDGAWRIAHPIEARADEFTVNDLSRAVRTAQMTEVLTEESDSREFPFARPLATVTVTDGKGSHELVVAQTGGSDPSQDATYYARSSHLPGVFGVSSTLAESLDKEVSEFRDMNLFGFGYDDPARVEVRAGSDTVTVVRAADLWQLESDGGREVEGEAVQTLLDRLRGLTATEIRSDRAADQARYGLDDPAIEASVTPAGDNEETERVRVSSPDEAPVYAARASEPATFVVERAVVENIVRSVEAIVRGPEDDTGGEPDAEEAVEGGPGT